MAFSALTHVSAGSSNGSTVTTGSIDTTGATLLVGALAGGDGTTLITDSKSNTWHALTAHNTNASIQIFWSAPSTVGSGHTFSGSSGAVSLAMQAFSGSPAASPVDQQNGAAGASPLAAGSVTPTTANQVLVAAVSLSGTVPSAISGGFTISESVALVGGQHFGIGLAYLIQTSATAANPAWTAATTDDAVIATFKLGGTTTNQTLSATQGQTATIGTVRTRFQTLSAAQGQTATIAVPRMLFRTLTATQAQIASLVRSIIHPPRQVSVTGRVSSTVTVRGRTTNTISVRGRE